jgi:predicted RND superfamily exporter protein
MAEAHHGIGKALLFCGTSSAIGFGSLAWASAYGLASLGLVCAVGLLLNMITAIWLLPHWYRWFHFPKKIDLEKASFVTDKKLSFR